MKKAIAEENWINGLAHALNLAEKEGFKEASKKYAPLRRHRRRVKKLCRYVRKKKMKLPSKLVLGCKTRWHFFILEEKSLKNVWKEVTTIMIRRDQSARLKYIKEDYMSKLIDFYEPWEECYKLVSVTSKPSLHHVVHIYVTLRDSLMPQAEDSAPIMILKRETLAAMIKVRRIITHYHLAAYRLRGFKPSLPEDFGGEEAECDDFIRSLMNDVNPDHAKSAQELPPKKVRILNSKKKKSIYDDSDYSDDDEIKMDPREGDELDKYLMDNSKAGFKKRHLWDDPYLFWNSDYARGKYKTLRTVAQIIFSVPAGAVGCERLFSALKRVVNSRSTRLTP